MPASIDHGIKTRVLAWSGALALLLGSSGAFAQAVDPPYRYIVQKGDTLYTLAKLYMHNLSDYKTVQQLNKLSDPRVMPTSGILLIPNQLLKTDPIIGEIASFRGTVTVDGKPAEVGTKVGQGMRVETGAGAFVTVRLPDATTISLPSQSRIYVEKMRRILLTGSLDRKFLLETGRAQSAVTPIKNPASNFRVTTPLSVSAVRGTEFRVAFDPADGGRALTEVVGGTVGVAPDAEKPETSVPKTFGIVATPAGLEAPTPLLAAPQLLKVERNASGGIAVSFKPVDGAKKYRTELAADEAFLDIFNQAITDVPKAELTLPGNATFFVRLTAIAESGLEGLPMTYGSGRGPQQADAGGSGSGGH